MEIKEGYNLHGTGGVDVNIQWDLFDSPCVSV